MDSGNLLPSSNKSSNLNVSWTVKIGTILSQASTTSSTTRYNSTSTSCKKGIENDCAGPVLGAVDLVNTRNTESSIPLENLKLTLSEWYPLVCIMLLAVAMNATICFIYCNNRKMRKRFANTLLFNRACIDTFSSTVYIPILISSYYWPEADFVRSTIFIYSVFLSLFGIISMAIERTFSVVFPLRHLALDDKVVLTGVAVTWSLPIPIAVANLTWFYSNGKGKGQGYLIYMSLTFTLMVGFSLCVIVMYIIIFSYIAKVFRENNVKSQTCEINLRTHRIASESENKKRVFTQELKLAKLGCFLFLFHIFGYYPTVCVNLFVLIKKYHLIKKSVVIFAVYSYLLNTLFDPVMAFLMKQDYKNSLIAILQNKRWKN